MLMVGDVEEECLAIPSTESALAFGRDCGAQLLWHLCKGLHLHVGRNLAEREREEGERMCTFSLVDRLKSTLHDEPPRGDKVVINESPAGAGECRQITPNVRETIGTVCVTCATTSCDCVTTSCDCATTSMQHTTAWQQYTKYRCSYNCHMMGTHK